MGTSKLQPPSSFPETLAGRLDSWKEIAAYLKRDERTVRRWEREGLPIHRHMHKKQASIYAHKAEIDVWWNNGRQRLEPPEPTSASKPFRPWLLAGLVAAGILALVAFNATGLRHRFLGKSDASTIRSLAVLPLENLSRDPDQEYFADGMTEALTTELAQIGSLKVISHTSVVQYKGTKKPLPQIAQELNVDAVIEGAVQRSGDKVEITVQLIQAPSDRHLWAKSYERGLPDVLELAKSYERGLPDVLELQREVTHSITDEIRAKLTSPEERRLLSAARSINPEAYEDYLKGHFLLWRQGESDARTGIAYFQRAIQKDPNYALPYAGIAECYITLGQPWNGALSPKEILTQAKAAASKALALDESLGEAHSAFAHVIELYDWDWQGAEKEYRRALELNPNDAMARFWFGEYLQVMGRNEEGFAQMRQAIALSRGRTWLSILYGTPVRSGNARIPEGIGAGTG